MKLSHCKQGFTLLELILYIGLLSIVLSGAIMLAWDIIYTQEKSTAIQEVSQNLRLASRRIGFEIRNSSDILSVSLSQLCLESSPAERNPTKIYLENERIKIGWGGTCDSPAVDNFLTSNRVAVTDLTIENLSSADGQTQNIRYSLEIQSAGERKEYQTVQRAGGAAEIRLPTAVEEGGETQIPLSGKIITASMFEETKENLVDNNLGTAFGGDSGGAMFYWQVDLGGSFTVSRARVYSAQAGTGWKIASSLDELSWTDRTPLFGPTIGEWDEFVFSPPFEARYIRLIKPTGMGGFCYELELYTSP